MGKWHRVTSFWISLKASCDFVHWVHSHSRNSHLIPSPPGTPTFNGSGSFQVQLTNCVTLLFRGEKKSISFRAKRLVKKDWPTPQRRHRTLMKKAIPKVCAYPKSIPKFCFATRPWKLMKFGDTHSCQIRNAKVLPLWTLPWHCISSSNPNNNHSSHPTATATATATAPTTIIIIIITIIITTIIIIVISIISIIIIIIITITITPSPSPSRSCCNRRHDAIWPKDTTNVILYSIDKISKNTFSKTRIYNITSQRFANLEALLLPVCHPGKGRVSNDVRSAEVV